MSDAKPLNWTPTLGIGYSVIRRDDGGMHFTFTDVDHDTLAHWRDFAMDHLMDADGLTRNLYDLRQVGEITPAAVNFAVEANSDPSARNIRLAVVLASPDVANGIREIAALSSAPGGSEIKLFTDIDEAEEWLSQPLNSMV
jgi:hypothetical protein